MRIQQLIEGQKEQIAGLRPSAPVALYYPTDVEGAAQIVMQENSPEQYEVMPSLKHAVAHGDVVVQFYGQGKDLEAPREASRSAGDQHYAQQTYPDSFNPLISFSLLSQRPSAIYTGLVSPSNIEKIYVMQDGRPETMNIKQFLEYAVKLQADKQRLKPGLTWK